MPHFDTLETRSADQREADLARDLPALIAHAETAPAMAASLAGIDAAQITNLAALAHLPVIRKSDLSAAQKQHPPLGGFLPKGGRFEHVFQSPGPIYEIGRTGHDWWRMGAFCMPAASVPVISCRIALAIT